MSLLNFATYIVDNLTRNTDTRYPYNFFYIVFIILRKMFTIFEIIKRVLLVLNGKEEANKRKRINSNEKNLI